MVTVRKVKTFMGMDCPGYNCELLFNGKPVACVVQDGSGGETQIEWKSPEDEKTVLAWAKSLPMPDMSDVGGTTLPESHDKTGFFRLDVAIEEAIAKQDMDKRLKRMCKKKTIFLLPGEVIAKGYRSLNIPWGPKAKEFLAKKFPKAKVLNEEYA